MEEKVDIPETNITPKPPINKKVPDFPPIERQNWLIHMHFIQKDYDVCELLVKEQLAETNFGCEYALYVQGLICRQKGRLQDSLSNFQQCALMNPNNINNFIQVAKTLFIMGRTDSAIQVYMDALKLVTPGMEWEIEHNLGLCYMQLGDFDSAKEHLVAALKSKNHEQTLMMIGKIFVIQKNYEEAVKYFEQAADTAPENTDILMTLGLLYIDLSDRDRAFEKLGSALSVESGHVQSLLAAGTIIQQYGDYDAALSKYRMAASKAPENHQLWNNIGMALFAKKKFVAAISCLTRAHYLAPFEWRVAYNLGLIYLNTKQYASSFRFLNNAAQLISKFQSISTSNHTNLVTIDYKKKYGSMVYMMLAVCLNNLKDPDNAEKAYFEALKLNNESFLVLYNYAVFLYKHQNYRDANKYIQLTLDLAKPTDPANETPDQYDQIIKACKELEAQINVGSIDVAAENKRELQQHEESINEEGDHEIERQHTPDIQGNEQNSSDNDEFYQ